MDEQIHNSTTATTPEPGWSDVAQMRREQILDAAESIIAGEGIHRLSLGRIEEKAGKLSRGQLTYYFPTKESILLAVFERMLQRMIAEVMRADGPKPMTGRAWDCLQYWLGKHLDPSDRPGERDLFSLSYTFLAQMNHRPDYRDRLAELQRERREFIAADIAGSVPRPPVSPQVSASLIQALLHGLRAQLAVDPNAFDRDEMAAACLRLLAPLFGRGDDAFREGEAPAELPSRVRVGRRLGRSLALPNAPARNRLLVRGRSTWRFRPIRARRPRRPTAT